MFVKLERFRLQGADEAVHGQMELGVIPLNGLHESAYLDFCIEFLLDFAGQRLLRSLPRLHLAAGKFPPTLPWTISTLSRKDFSVLDYYRRYYFYRLHDSSSFDCSCTLRGT